MSSIEIGGLGVRFGATPVLRDLDLTVGEGERVAVLGANGTGKTTLLRAVAGLLRPSGGRVSVLGGRPTDPRVRRGIGLVGHQPFLYPRLTAGENVRLWTRLYAGRGRARGEELLAELGLDPRDRRPAVSFSQGMRRRIGVACALAHRPDLVLCDEPFAGLDEDGASIVQRLLAAEGHSVLLATHEPGRARPLAHRFLTLAGGRLHEQMLPA